MFVLASRWRTVVLNRNVSQQVLNLFQFASQLLGKGSTGFFAPARSTCERNPSVPYLRR
jgi:hypothetical protein